VALVHVTGEAHESAPGVRAPVRREESGEGGNEVRSTVVVDRRREGLDLGRRVDDAEVVAQPLHQRTGDGDRALERVVRLGVAQLVAERREKAVLRVHDLFAGVEDQEVTGAVGVLRLAGFERRLSEGGRLLVAQDAGYRYLAQQRRRLDGAVDLRRRTDLGHHRQRYAEDAEDLLVPLQGLEVHEQGARRVGDIGGVHAALGAAGEVPENPGVGRAEQQVAGIRLLAGALDVLEDPDDLGSREVGGERESDLGLEPLDASVGRETVDDVLRAGVLPDDGVVDGLAGVLVPHHRGLALVGDAHRLDVVTGDVGLRQRLSDDLARVAPDLLGVVLDPARLRQDLVVLHLSRRDDPALVVEDDRPRARRALVDSDYIFGHELFHSFVVLRVGVEVAR
jgi:hypothetical protein